MIKSLEIYGLNGSDKPLKFEFNNDLNLFTGLNGCGKTTILKLLWYVNSGKISNYLQEIKFSSLHIVSDYYSMEIKNLGDIYDVCGFSSNGEVLIQQKLPLTTDSIMQRRLMEDVFDKFNPYSEYSVFFPTFRRIEGGFSMENRGPRFRRGSFPLKDAMLDLSEDLSSEKHKFIASVSTDDLTALLNKEYSAIVREINEMQRNKFDEIRGRIKRRGKNTPENILKEIEKDIKEVEEKSSDSLKPFNVLGELIMKVFHKKGIDMDGITFGENNDAISSDKLSAGEKQMLSFLCYNTFSKNKIIFIDEPELSLHPDWQRLLIPTLLKQGNNNQFFIATHSPFIYTKYADKEIMLSKDKGDL